jgi:hypothetical protein
LEGYVVYGLRLDGYRGGSLVPSQALLKVGVSLHDALYRLETNERLEGANSYRALFETIEIVGEKKFRTKAQALAYERGILLEMGPKDLSIQERVTGVTELRLETSDRLLLLQAKL